MSAKKELIGTTYLRYKNGQITREAMMTALVKARMRNEVTEAEYKKYRDAVTADVFIAAST